MKIPNSMYSKQKCHPKDVNLRSPDTSYGREYGDAQIRMLEKEKPREEYNYPLITYKRRKI